MCLITTKDIPEIAQEDIVCYKLYKLRDNKLLSPYREVVAPNINEVTNTVLDRACVFNYKGNHVNYSVSRGFHSYKNISNSKEELRFWIHFLAYSNVRIFKCIIPKGTKYYEGKFGDFPSYCSESIILKETIDVE